MVSYKLFYPCIYMNKRLNEKENDGSPPLKKNKSSPQTKKKVAAVKKPKAAKKPKAKAATKKRTTTKQKMDVIVYHEGGDSYRPVIHIELLPELWVNRNILFYRSSSRSNNNMVSTRNTWFPIGGMVDETMMNQKENFNYGHLIKMSDINHIDMNESYIWLYGLLYDYFYEKAKQTNTEFYYLDLNTLMENPRENRKLSQAQNMQIQNNKKNENMIQSYELANEFANLYNTCNSYFMYDWQIYISASFGGELWNAYPDLRLMILDRYHHYHLIPLPNISGIPLYDIENMENTNDDIFPHNQYKIVDAEHFIAFSREKNTQTTIENFQYLEETYRQFVIMTFWKQIHMSIVNKYNLILRLNKYSLK